MSKYRWYSAAFGMTTAKLADRMRRRAFVASQDDDTEGFRVQERRGTSLVGQYIERQVWVEHIVLPTGDEYEEPRSRAWITHFSISEGTTLNLLLTDPPRRTAQFLNALDEASAYDCTISPVQVSLLGWIEAIERNVGAAKVTYAECSGVQLSPTVLGRYAFRGSDDVRSEVHKVVGPKKRATMDVARCEFMWEGQRAVLDLSRQGVAKVEVNPTGMLSLLTSTIVTAHIN
jgi:hypothetical protein